MSGFGSSGMAYKARATAPANAPDDAHLARSRKEYAGARQPGWFGAANAVHYPPAWRHKNWSITSPERILAEVNRLSTERCTNVSVALAHNYRWPRPTRRSARGSRSGVCPYSRCACALPLPSLYLERYLHAGQLGHSAGPNTRFSCHVSAQLAVANASLFAPYPCRVPPARAGSSACRRWSAPHRPPPLSCRTRSSTQVSRQGSPSPLPPPRGQAPPLSPVPPWPYRPGPS